jgi:hypothetical protein
MAESAVFFLCLMHRWEEMTEKRVLKMVLGLLALVTVWLVVVLFSEMEK